MVGAGTVVQVNSTTGQVFVNADINYQRKSSYKLTFAMSDNGVPPLTTLVNITANIISTSWLPV